MQSHEIRQRFLDFFAKRGHAVIPSASLVPENDPSVLFNTAGMQPLVPYLMGQSHPSGKRLVNCQKCVRTQDIDEVGDNTHDTFFEMLGNWSLGDYFKEDTIKWSYEFLTSKEEGLGLDSSRLYVTVFEGDENAPKDIEAFEIWKKYIPENRIYYMSAKSNWWSVGDNGPCGPDTEMFYDITPDGLGDLTKEEYMKADEAQQIVEIWNDVFMQYEKKDGKVVGKLTQQNVDTGSGLERIVMAVQGKNNIFDTDLFSDIIAKIEEFTTGDDTRAKRIVADHIRTSVLLIADGVVPSKSKQGYILRRLLRRAVRYADILKMESGSLVHLVDIVIEKYKMVYPEILEKKGDITTLILDEEIQFRKTLSQGLKEFEKGIDPFILATTYGFPIELTEELAKEKGITIDRAKFDQEMKEHQEKSRSASAGMFKGGLAGHGDMEIKYHTATHMLNQALREVLGNHVVQKGSNITPERLRFDFSHADKMTDEEIKRVESLVNEKIQESLPVIRLEMSLDQARLIGALGVFGDKYDSMVSVYQIGEGDDLFSREICGGPHVENTKELGTFSIKKEEASSAGVRRIKAVLS